SRRRRTRPARGGRLDDLPAAVLVGGTGREPRAALAGRAIRRRPALRIRRGSGRDGPTPLRLAAHPSGVPVPRLSLRRGAAQRRYGRQRPPGRARGCERRGVLPSLLLSPSRGGATGGLLPRGGAALGREAASSAWRHRVLSRGRCGVYRAAQLAARAAELLALWDEKTEPPGGGATERIEQRAAARRRMWRDLLLFGEHTWGSPASGSDPDGADTVAQWQYKRRFLDGAA